MKTNNKHIEKSRLGRLLVNRGYITEFQLEQALECQRANNGRLGDILLAEGWVCAKDLERTLRHQNRYRNAAAFAAMLAAPLQPMMAFAASAPAAATGAPVSTQQVRGLQALSEDEMGEVSAQGLEQLFEQVERVQKSASGDESVNSVDGLKLVARAVMPVYNLLDADVSIEGVHYAEGKPQMKVHADGKIELALPERIEEISMNNIRVAGTNAGSFGDITMTDIQFHPDSRMTIYAR